MLPKKAGAIQRYRVGSMLLNEPKSRLKVIQAGIFKVVAEDSKTFGQVFFKYC